VSAPASPGLAVLDAWEALRAHVLNGSRAASEEARRRAESDWRTVTPRDRATVAIAVILGLEPGNPTARRHCRQMLREIEDHQPDCVREDSPPDYRDLSDARRETLRRAASALLDPDFEKRLSAAAGPVAAHQLVERVVPGLSGSRAGRFLVHIGYPMIVADKSRSRWLLRFGLIGKAGESKAARAEALRRFGEFAHETGAPLAELDLVLGVFTGADAIQEGISLCLQRPQCRACPLRTQCAYARFIETHDGVVREEEIPARARTLADAVLPEDRPREKLQRLGPGALGNAELIAILLRTGNGKEHAMDLAARVLREAGTLDLLARMSVAELMRTCGLGTVQAITVKAALELARRVSESKPLDEPIDTAAQVFARMRGYYLGREKETFICLAVDAKHRLIRQIIVSEGIVNQSLVHPREAFAEAMRDSAVAVFFVHNHPSGDPTPSVDDRRTTARLVQAGDIVGIRVLDHVIVGRDSYYSFEEASLLRTVG